jgi:1-deoxy-D-xylulose-5-phosphate reductoisomerase
MRKIQYLSLLGSTGSIGCQTLDVADKLKDHISIRALAAHSNVELLKKQIIRFRPELACIYDTSLAAGLHRWARSRKLRTNILSGPDGLDEVAGCSQSDIVLSSVVGSIGLIPLITAIKAGKTIALANKEALVIAGGLINSLKKRSGSQIIPVDSEHSAIFQCLKNEEPKYISKLILTASGGPFYRYGRRHADITVKRALAHPTWKMGPKITVDSATLMNKGLEAIEASYLFNVTLDKIEILIHPQSIIHSMVEFEDSSVIAQLSEPDMRLPIQYALTYPKRMRSQVRKLDLAAIGALTFDKPDFKKFPCLDLAIGAGKAGGTAPAAMNAANETAVKAFLNKRIKFVDIPKVVSKVLDKHSNMSSPALVDILSADSSSRILAEQVIENI